MLSFASSGKIPDEAKALSLLAPAPTMTSLMPGAGLLPIPTPTPLTTVSKVQYLYDFQIIQMICGLFCVWGARTIWSTDVAVRV